MNKRLLTILLALACLVLLVGGVLALTTPGYAITWSVFASGGAVQSDNYALSSSIGQPVTGAVEGKNYRLGSGYRSAEPAPVEYPLYLPIIKK